MYLPKITGWIERRILVNYRVAPELLEPHLPAGFRPQLVNGFGIAGICLIRLAKVRPCGLPAWCGIGSENAAHRIAVEWNADGKAHTGVYIPRRDSNSRLNQLLGGRVFPGVHHHAQFNVKESQDELLVEVRSDDGCSNVSVHGHVSRELPDNSVFGTLHTASAFFAGGSLGYSPTSRGDRLQGLNLECFKWEMEPLEVTSVRSSFFDDTSLFPPGSVEFDCALLMRGIEHRWHGSSDLCCHAPPAHHGERRRENLMQPLP